MTAIIDIPTQYGLYVRESTEAQLAGVEFNSLQSQESYLRKRVAAKGPGSEVFRVYSDTESGTKLAGRDGLMRLVHDAEQGKIQVAVAYEMDRWARNANDYTSLKAQLASVGVRLESATLHFDDSPEGELMELQMAGFAQYFCRLVGRKVKTKRGEMAAKGMWLGGGLAFGYANNGGKLEVAPEEAAVVRQIFELFARERSTAVVRHRLRALGIKNRNKTDWNNTNISYILHNRTTSVSCSTTANGTGGRRSH